MLPGKESRHEGGRQHCSAWLSAGQIRGGYPPRIGGMRLNKSGWSISVCFPQATSRPGTKGTSWGHLPHCRLCTTQQPLAIPRDYEPSQVTALLKAPLSLPHHLGKGPNPSNGPQSPGLSSMLPLWYPLTHISRQRAPCCSSAMVAMLLSHSLNICYSFCLEHFSTR